MKTGFKGTFVISWSQTELDGLSAAPMECLTVGAAWMWHGEAVRVDGPSNLLRLDQSDDSTNIRKRAARTVRRLVGAAVQNKTDLASVEVEDPTTDSAFVVTDGRKSYMVTVIEVAPGSHPLLMFVDDVPPRSVDLWVVHQSMALLPRQTTLKQGGGVICFTPGTRISTPDGAIPVEKLREGDRIQTRDNGTEEIMWIGSRRMTGARFFVMPKLRPIRIGAGALGIERPDQELLVSPDHRMLVRGPAARTLFNTSEVLVPASELVNGTSVSVDLKAREITYIHLLLPSHQILWANGVETESFHPASASLASLGAGDLQRLLMHLPGVDKDPHSYGGYARRSLSPSESAILLHEAA